MPRPKKSDKNDYSLTMHALYNAFYSIENPYTDSKESVFVLSKKPTTPFRDRLLEKAEDKKTPIFASPSDYGGFLRVYSEKPIPRPVFGSHKLFLITHLGGWKSGKADLADKTDPIFHDNSRPDGGIREEFFDELLNWKYARDEKGDCRFFHNNRSVMEPLPAGSRHISEYIVECNHALISNYYVRKDILRQIILDFADNMDKAERIRLDKGENSLISDPENKKENGLDELKKCLKEIINAYDQLPDSEVRREWLLSRALSWLVIAALLRKNLTGYVIDRCLKPYMFKAYQIDTAKDITETFKSQNRNNEFYDRLKKVFENERKNHPSIRIMNSSRDLFPKGFPEIRSDIRTAEERDVALRTIKDMVLDSWKKADHRHILLIGEGGIGKTVAMLTMPVENWFCKYNIPVIYISLQRLDLYDGNLSDYIQAKFGNDYGSIVKLANNDFKDNPSLLLLLDGFNEVPDKYKRIAEKSIREWIEKPGIQVITTSRLGFSLESSFSKYILKPLSIDTIKTYLLSAGKDEKSFPEDTDKIWKVINIPLMLIIYTQIDRVKKTIQDPYISRVLDWKKPDNAAHIIWNYLQMELYRCLEKMDVSHSPVQYAVVIFMITPYICCQMAYRKKFFVNHEELQNMIRDILFFYSTQKNMLNQQILNIYRRYDRYSEEDIFQSKKVSEYSRILTESLVFFQGQESIDKDGKLIYTYSLIHQNFRDAFAAFFICSCLPRIQLGKEKRKLLDYADFHIKNYIAEYLSEDELEKIWNQHRTEEPEDGHITWILMDIIGRQKNYDYSGIDFSQIDFSKTNIYSLLSKRIDICPLPRRKELFSQTKISMKSIAPNCHTSGISSVTYSPSGRKIVSCSSGGTLRIWNLDSGENRILDSNFLGFTSTAFSSDGMKVACGSNDKIIRIYNLDSGEKATFGGHTRRVTSIVFSPSGKLVSGSNDKTLRIWDLNSGECRILKGHMGIINCITCSPSGEYVASCSDDGTVIIWDIISGEGSILYECSEGIVSVMYSPDGKQIVCGSDDGAVRILNVEARDNKLLKNISGRINSVAYSPDGRQVACGTDEGIIRIWNLDSGDSLILSGHTGRVKSVTYSPDSGQLISGSYDRSIRIWNLEDKEYSVLYGSSEGIAGISYIHESRLLAGGSSDDGTIRIWNLESDKYNILDGRSNGFKSIVQSPDGNNLAGILKEKCVQIWDINNKDFREVNLDADWINSVAYCVGRRIESGGSGELFPA